MKKTGTRRSFFSWTRNALAMAGALRATPSLAATEAVAHGEDYYAKLGVTKIINAAGTYTALTASIMPPSVQAAVAEAASLSFAGRNRCSIDWPYRSALAISISSCWAAR